MPWKYGLILIYKKGDSINNDPYYTFDEDVNEFVELYDVDNNGEYASFCPPKINDFANLELAYKDIKRDGINTWFYDNGQFKYNVKESKYDWEELPKKPIKTATCAIDFDGVVNSYKSGFVAIDKLPDPPVEGAFDFIRKLLKRGHEVAIFSTRNSYPEGISAIKDWMLKWGLEPEIVSVLSFPDRKPIAKLFIDDRSWCFRGTFPSVSKFELFLPWHGGKSSSEKD